MRVITAPVTSLLQESRWGMTVASMGWIWGKKREKVRTVSSRNPRWRHGSGFHWVACSSYKPGELCMCCCSSLCCRGPWGLPSEDTIPWKLCVAFPWSLPEDSMNQVTLADTLTTRHARPASIHSESPGLQAVGFLKHMNKVLSEMLTAPTNHVTACSSYILKPS